MGNARWSGSFRSYTPTASSAATDHPATNVALATKPQRSWRSTALGAQWLKIDLGSSLVVPLWYFGDCNFATALTEYSADNTNWTSTGNITIDQGAAGRRKRSWEINGATWTSRYLRITPDPASVDGGATYFEIGAVLACSSVTTLSRNVPAWRWEVVEPESRLELLGGGTEVNREGAAFVRYQFEASRWVQGTARTELLALLAATRAGAAILFDENRARPQDTCLVLREGAGVWNEASRVFDVAPFALREAR